LGSFEERRRCLSRVSARETRKVFFTVGGLYRRDERGGSEEKTKKKKWVSGIRGSINLEGTVRDLKRQGNRKVIETRENIEDPLRRVQQISHFCRGIGTAKGPSP